MFYFIVALINTGFPDGDLPTIMDTAIVCVGNESRLIDCMHENRERPNCVNSSIGLICGGMSPDKLHIECCYQGYFNNPALQNYALMVM